MREKSHNNRDSGLENGQISNSLNHGKSNGFFSGDHRSILAEPIREAPEDHALPTPPLNKSWVEASEPLAKNLTFSDLLTSLNSEISQLISPLENQSSHANFNLLCEHLIELFIKVDEIEPKELIKLVYGEEKEHPIYKLVSRLGLFDNEGLVNLPSLIFYNQTTKKVHINQINYYLAQILLKHIRFLHHSEDEKAQLIHQAFYPDLFILEFRLDIIVAQCRCNFFASDFSRRINQVKASQDELNYLMSKGDLVYSLIARIDIGAQQYFLKELIEFVDENLNRLLNLTVYTSDDGAYLISHIHDSVISIVRNYLDTFSNWIKNVASDGYHSKSVLRSHHQKLSDISKRIEPYLENYEKLQRLQKKIQHNIVNYLKAVLNKSCDGLLRRQSRKGFWHQLQGFFSVKYKISPDHLREKLVQKVALEVSLSITVLLDLRDHTTLISYTIFEKVLVRLRDFIGNVLTDNANLANEYGNDIEFKEQIAFKFQEVHQQLGTWLTTLQALDDNSANVLMPEENLVPTSFVQKTY